MTQELKTPKTFAEYYEWLESHEPNSQLKDTDAQGSVQWKGTEACADIHCKCGNHMHFDQFFLYHVRCSNCGTVYTLCQSIKLIETPPQIISYLTAAGHNIVDEYVL